MASNNLDDIKFRERVKLCLKLCLKLSDLNNCLDDINNSDFPLYFDKNWKLDVKCWEYLYRGIIYKSLILLYKEDIFDKDIGNDDIWYKLIEILGSDIDIYTLKCNNMDNINNHIIILESYLLKLSNILAPSSHICYVLKKFNYTISSHECQIMNNLIFEWICIIYKEVTKINISTKDPICIISNSNILLSVIYYYLPSTSLYKGIKNLNNSINELDNITNLRLFIDICNEYITKNVSIFNEHHFISAHDYYIIYIKYILCEIFSILEHDVKNELVEDKSIYYSISESLKNENIKNCDEDKLNIVYSEADDDDLNAYANNLGLGAITDSDIAYLSNKLDSLTSLLTKKYDNNIIPIKPAPILNNEFQPDQINRKSQSFIYLSSCESIDNSNNYKLKRQKVEERLRSRYNSKNHPLISQRTINQSYNNCVFKQRSNKPTIKNAIIHYIYAVKTDNVNRNTLLQILDSSHYNHFLILFHDRSNFRLQYRALYCFNPVTYQANKLTGTGPDSINNNELIKSVYRYVNSSKEFQLIELTSTLSIACDAFTIKNQNRTVSLI